MEPAWFEATVDSAVCTCTPIAAPPPSVPQELKGSPTVAPLLLSQISAYEENHFNVAALVGTLAFFLITYLLYVHQPSECSVHDIVMARLYQAFPSSPLYCLLLHSCLLPPSLPHPPSPLGGGLSDQVSCSGHCGGHAPPDGGGEGYRT